MNGRERLVGVTHFLDELDNSTVANEVAIDLGDECREVTIAPIGHLGRPSIVRAITPEQVRYVDRIVAEMRRQASRRRPARPVPKPRSSARKHHIHQVCPTCNGDGVIDDPMGGLMACPDCVGGTQ